MGRRDSTDERWKALKEKITKRDKSTCRLMRILTAQEYLLLRKKAPAKLLERLDHAHIKAVSERPDLCYDYWNCVLLNRYSHENLDNCRDPITAEPITKDERNRWWLRIMEGNAKQYEYLITQQDYFNELREELY